ncbi:hypothetical protein H6S82_27350 [Planktothrix sp. FACHB-1355]|uniref:Uncharacterized protein n=1 Tax=Aerosakkonema funiforme FACHB-1375 TaxID=2949571 RepID=A0A926ZFJ9_9CYAN|nr:MULTISPECIES: hypothetical protein [Oscillatoriales]MBD2180157.1 hypothetical protein [Aerosakkonema funiforme FACHB-1375]MBD3562531.1 hypothetical protein [Planktothrix sp. FACHB-1355]
MLLCLKRLNVGIVLDGEVKSWRSLIALRSMYRIPVIRTPTSMVRHLQSNCGLD